MCVYLHIYKRNTGDYTHMARANIYIHKENEERWEKLEKKSEWVNAMLAVKPMTVTDVYMLDQEVEYANKMKEKKMATDDKDYKLCKHGAYPAFCKHASPGKPCK